MLGLIASEAAWSKSLSYCPPENTSTALVIIDMQPFFMGRLNEPKHPENLQKIEALLSNQLSLIQKAKENHIPIIFVTYDGDFGRTHYRLIEAVITYDKVSFFKKNSDGMFDSYNFNREQLARQLNEFKVGSLIVTGINGDSCVLQSIRGALKNNCSVILYSPGVANFSFAQLVYPYTAPASLAALSSQCQNCSFHESSDLAEIEAQMRLSNPKTK